MSEAGFHRPDLRHYLGVLWRYKWVLLAIVVLIPAGVYAISSRAEKVYETRTTLLVRGTDVRSTLSANPITVSTSSPTQVARLVETPVVANLAAKKLGQPPEDGRGLLGSITAAVEDTSTAADLSGSGFLNITARSNDPDRARELADAFASAVETRRTKDALNAIDDAIRTLSAEAAGTPQGLTKQNLLTQVQQLQALRPSQESKTQIVDPAVTPSGAISPTPRRNAILGLIFALILCAGLLPLLDRLDVKLRRPEEIEEAGAAPMLAMIPTSAFPGEVPKPTVREAFQTLRAGLTSFHVDHTLATVAVTSPGRGDGKTTVATNLSVALAQDRRDVILVDGDLRRGDAADRLGVSFGAGLEAVLLGERGVQDALHEVTGIEGSGRLRVLPSGTPPPNPSILLGSERMRSVLAELSEIADVVVIDTPPLLTVSDALPLFEHLSGVVVVARLDFTTRDAVRKTIEILKTAKSRILGGVVTGVGAGGIYGRGYYLQGYEFEPKSDEEAALAGTNGGTDGGPLSRLRARTRRRSETPS